MTSKTYIIVPDPHAHPAFNNNRADWLGKLILDVRPDVVVNMGDTFDMPSLSSFDKGKASFVGASYEKDIESGVDFLDRMWHPIRKAKKKKPKSIYLYANHERRLDKVLEYQPELSGSKYGISRKDFCLEDYFSVVVDYKGLTPGIYNSDGINFAHFMVSGVMGRPIGGENHARSLLTKTHSSCIVAHSHLLDYAVHSSPDGRKTMGLVSGVFTDYTSPWAGHAGDLWWSGLQILRNVEGGTYDLTCVSMEALERIYG